MSIEVNMQILCETHFNSTQLKFIVKELYI